jgi:hypothetical protein
MKEGQPGNGLAAQDVRTRTDLPGQSGYLRPERRFFRDFIFKTVR